jgi:hypothetical protein
MVINGGERRTTKSQSHKDFFLVLFVTLCLCGSSFAQDEESGARDIFLSTRPQSTPNQTKSRINNTKKRPNAGKPAKEQASLGLGYTIFKRDEKGRAVRVDPSEHFKSGDRVRIMLEPNIDGYLYVFHTEGEGEPQMLFPDARLGEGRNMIQAHVPYEVPSSFDPNSERQWFVFSGDPNIENLFIVISRQPLKNVPTGEELVKICKSDLENCVWRPTGDTWNELLARTGARAKVSKSKPVENIQSTIEKESIGRAVGLPKTAPSPSVIRMNNSTETDILVTMVSLIHK